MKIKNYFLLLSASFIASLFSLSACSSSEPTEAEMFQAMINADQNHRMFGDLTRIIAETKKSECGKIRENIYKCGIVWKDGKGGVFPFITFTKVGEKWKVAM